MASVIALCAGAALATTQTGKATAKTHHPTSTSAKSTKSSESAGSKTASKRTAQGKTSKTKKRGKRARSGKTSRRDRGQQTIDSARATEIQQALIREKYLDGEPTGIWDQRTKDAIARYQADNGWQTKVLPDSRALIKLGLGPNHSNLINSDSTTTSHSTTTATAGKQ